MSFVLLVQGFSKGISRMFPWISRLFVGAILRKVIHVFCPPNIKGVH